MTLGTQGYERFASLFIESSNTLDFNVVCKDFISFLPLKPANILDVGAGAGQNSAALDELGFNVTAVEPMVEFLNAARHQYGSSSIEWLQGSLPRLACLDSHDEKFDFVLIDAVWHHLCESERIEAASKISSLIKTNGRCAISLRNGPAGIGTRIFPIDSNDTINLFKKLGFKCLFKLENQASLLPNKDKVKWTRIVMHKSG